MVINANRATLEDGDGVLDLVRGFLIVCGAQNVVTRHLSENGTKKVRSEGKIKAQLPFRVSLCLHIAFREYKKILGFISL